jgi:PPOX class probable F420-dependent enzyme
MSVIPETYRDPLERPLIGPLPTVRLDGTPQVNPRWVRFDDEHLWLSTTRTRQKVRNWKRRPVAAISILDPDRQDRYLEIRVRVERVLPERGAADYLRLAKRYGLTPSVPEDAPDRVAVAMRPVHTTSG